MIAVLDLDRRRIDQPDLRAQLAHDLELQGHVDDLGHVLDADRAVRQQSRRNNGDCRILCARDRNLAVERFTAVYNILGQTYLLLTNTLRGCPRPVYNPCNNV